MDPAVLADLVGGVRVDPLTGVQSVNQLAAKLSFAGLVIAFGCQWPWQRARYYW